MKPIEVEKTIYHHRGEQESGWSFWENYRALEKGKTLGTHDKNYEENLIKIVSFNDLSAFGVFWHNGLYDDSSNLLFNPIDDTEKRIIRNEKISAIECLNQFREGIKPAWEDPLNANGYDLRVELDVNPEKIPKEQIIDAYKQLWSDFVFSLIGEESPYASEINGIRYKYQPNRLVLRIEIWIKSKSPKDTPKDNDTLQGGNYENVADENLRIYWGIRTWLENTIKNIRKNQQNLSVQYTGHAGK